MRTRIKLVRSSLRARLARYIKCFSLLMRRGRRAGIWLSLSSFNSASLLLGRKEKPLRTRAEDKSENKEEFYSRRQESLRRAYWEGNREGNLYLPSGFHEYPHEIYDLFLSLITRDGKVLDLGCGNGLLLRHLITRARHKLVPYGVDFIEQSIQQAKTSILPEYADHFAVCNIADYGFPGAPYDFIFFDPYDLHPDDLNVVLARACKALARDGIIIFYTYDDVLSAYGYEWVGEFLPPELRLAIIKRIDHPEISIGVYSPGWGSGRSRHAE